MRTVILTSALIICDAIGTKPLDAMVISILVIMWTICVAMDISEFIHNLKN